MHSDRLRWNKKYMDGAQFGAPSPLLTTFFSLAKKGKALDIAAGTGRNAIFLAEKGFTVYAVDISDQAIASLHSLNHPQIMPIQADLDNFSLFPHSFDLILNFRFLDRRMFPYMQEALTPNGLLLFESSLESDLPDVWQPSHKEHILKKNELLHSFIGLRILFYQEKIEEDDLIARKKVCLALLAAQKT